MKYFQIFQLKIYRSHLTQILYEGEYQGIMRPMVHYIPLKKDFSNFDEVIGLLGDNEFRQRITDNCYRDLIASGRYSYQNFIESFDRELLETGCSSHITQEEVKRVSEVLSHDRPRKWIVAVIRMPISAEYPGKRVIVFFGRPIKNVYIRVKQYFKTSFAGNLKKGD